jgi:hypothetical protein
LATPERKPFLLRLPPKLHEELRRWAAQEMRSLNGQIEYLLREALRKRLGKELPGESSSKKRT